MPEEWGVTQVVAQSEKSEIEEGSPSQKQKCNYSNSVTLCLFPYFPHNISNELSV